MKSGKLVHKIALERSSFAITDAGEPITAWFIVRTMRAEIVENRMTDTQAESGSVTNAVCVFRIRYSPVEMSDRIVFGDDTYRILDVKVIGRNRELEIKAEVIDVPTRIPLMETPPVQTPPSSGSDWGSVQW